MPRNLKNWIFLFVFVRTLQAQILYRMDPVIVTASRIDTSWRIQSRETYWMDRNRIEMAPLSGISDLLQYSGGCDLARRGAGGTQADFSIRGSSFEQVLVLVDGVRMNNPQTGHHNADIPVAPADIDRIEVLAGHGSSLYGSSGFGGVVQVLSRFPENNRFQMTINGGAYGTAEGTVSQSFRHRGFSGSVLLQKSKSDGYRFDADYDNTLFTGRFGFQQGKNRIVGSFSQVKKDFGANGFYADYPSRENTFSRLARIRWENRPGRDLKIVSQVYWNRHQDAFLLDVNRPDGYRNRHTTTTTGASAQISGRLSSNGSFAAGLEAAEERMASSRMGDRKRFGSGLWNETVFLFLDRLSLNWSWRLDSWENRRTEWNPSMGMAVILSSRWQWKLSAGRVFRVPTFTELYYTDPANIGNPRLKPESGWCGETGWVWNGKRSKTEWTIFRRDESGRIDWIKENRSDPWRVANLPRNTVSGMSFSIDRSFGTGLTVSGSFTELRYSEPAAAWSKYLSNSLRRQMNVSAYIQWPWRVKQGVFLIMKKRSASKTYTVLDSKLSRRWRSLDFSVSCTNLTDAQYEDFPGIPMPGTSVMAGCAITLE